MDQAKSAPPEVTILIRILLGTNRVRAYLSPDHCLTLFEIVWERRFDSKQLGSAAFRALPLERKEIPLSAPLGATKVVFTQPYLCGSPAATPVVYEDYVRPPRRRPDRARFLINQVFWEWILTKNIRFENQHILDLYTTALYQRYDRSGLPIGLKHQAEQECTFPDLPASLRT